MYEGRLLLAFRDLVHNAKAQHGRHNASRLWVDLQVGLQRGALTCMRCRTPT